MTSVLLSLPCLGACELDWQVSTCKSAAEYRSVSDTACMSPPQIRVNQQERQLTIAGERQRKPANGEGAQSDEDAEAAAARQQRRERRFGKFKRTSAPAGDRRRRRRIRTVRHCLRTPASKPRASSILAGLLGSAFDGKASSALRSASCSCKMRIGRCGNADAYFIQFRSPCSLGSLLKRMRPCCRVDKGVLTLKVSKKAEAARPMCAPHITIR